MRPPICEVCGKRFSPREGALVTCLATEASEAFDTRAEQPGFVGHAPNKGWFCNEHRAEAERLAPTTTLANVVASIRAGSSGQASPTPSPPTPSPATPRPEPPRPKVPQPPASGRSADAPSTPQPMTGTEEVCDICGIVFDKATAGLVRFKRTQVGIDWRHAELRGEVSGTNPDAAWLCARHIGPALWVNRSFTRSEAMAMLAPSGATPLEYDDRPPKIDPDRQPDTFPQRGAFEPVADGLLDGVRERTLTFSPQTPDTVEGVLKDARVELGAVLGAADLRNGGRKGSHSDEPAMRRWGPPDALMSVSYSPYQVGDVVVFDIGIIYRSGSRSGPIVQQAKGLLVQQREQSIFDAWFGAAETPTVAADGLVMLERAVVRRARGLDDDIARALDNVIDQALSPLAATAPDPLDLAPDLVDVDLGTGQVERYGWRVVGSAVTWKGVGSLGSVRAAFVDSLPTFLAALGIDEAIELQASTRREWNPMDGAQPPHCPFTDHWTWEGSAGDVSVDITASSTNWNEDDVSNTHANLSIWVGGERTLSLSASHRVDTNDPPSLTLVRPTTAATVAAVRSVFDC